MTVLPPGDYILDIDFDRPVSMTTLGQVLAQLGFEKVVPDQMPSTGALGTSFSSSMTSSISPTTSPTMQMYTAPTPAPAPVPSPTIAPTMATMTAPAPTQSFVAPAVITVPPKVATPAPTQSFVAPTVVTAPKVTAPAPTQSFVAPTVVTAPLKLSVPPPTTTIKAPTVVTAPATAPAVRWDTPLTPKPSSPTLSAMPVLRTALPTTPGVQATVLTAPPLPPNKGFSAMPGGGSFASPGGGDPSPPPVPPKPEIDRNILEGILKDDTLEPGQLIELAMEIEKQGFMKEGAELRARAAELKRMQEVREMAERAQAVAPGYIPMSSRSFAEMPTASSTHVSSPSIRMTTSPTMKLLEVRNLWLAWKQTGNPFSGPRTSGVPSKPKSTRIRFVARLGKPIEVQDRPDVRWVQALPLGIDPFAQVSTTLVPFPLDTGFTYEFRFVSRTKGAPTRSAVERMLQKMGFELSELSAIKRDMRFPGRPGANLVLWHGVGRWKGPPSVVVADDPLYFSDMRVVA